MKSIRLGIVGACGRGGKLFRKISDIFEGVTLSAVCDINEAELEPTREELGAQKAYLDFDAMIESGDVDTVIIGTPMQFHVPQAVTALSGGVHVLSEVPAGVSIDQCRDLVAAARASTARYMMSENYIFQRPNMTVREIVRAGKFGTLYYAEGEYLHELKGLNERTTWRRRRQTGVNGVTYGTHSLGPILQWFEGERVTSVCCAGSGHHYRDPRGDLYENEDSVVMLCRLSGGGLVKIRVDMISDRPHAMTNYQLQGTDGSYEAARTKSETNRIWLREEDERKRNGAAVSDGAAGNSTAGGTAAADGAGATPRQPVNPRLEWSPLESIEDRYLSREWREDADEALRAGHGGGDYFALKEFFSALREEREPLIGIDRAMDLTLPGLISQQSIEQDSRWLPVPDSRDW